MWFIESNQENDRGGEKKIEMFDTTRCFNLLFTMLFTIAMLLTYVLESTCRQNNVSRQNRGCCYAHYFHCWFFSNFSQCISFL